jgi:UDP-glucose 4-epimerase
MLSVPVPASPQSILVTGGAGYIGSHVVLALLDSGFHDAMPDNPGSASSCTFAPAH